MLCLGVAMVTGITIPVDSMRDRCMVVFATRPEDYLKIDIKFPKFQDQGDNDYYSIVLTNTETHTDETFSVKEGTFRREIQLTESIQCSSQLFFINCVSGLR